jgi:sterol desaturase/sphingolipid hydroxylase (fatty acid hydroxylase superfamily)
MAAGVRLRELALYELMMFSVVQFHHANVGLPCRVERALRWFLVTPGMHKVHHSRLPAETNSNYSSLFSLWDRVFGSFRVRRDPGQIQFGLEDFDRPRLQGFWGIWRTPGVVPGKMGLSLGWLVWIPPVLFAAWVASRAALWYLG